MGFDHQRLMKLAEVIVDAICRSSREVRAVHSLFLACFELHRTVYNHKAAISIAALISDVVTRADPLPRITDAITVPHTFLGMADCMLHTIQHSREALLVLQELLLNTVGQPFRLAHCVLTLLFA